MAKKLKKSNLGATSEKNDTKIELVVPQKESTPTADADAEPKKAVDGEWAV